MFRYGPRPPYQQPCFSQDQKNNEPSKKKLSANELAVIVALLTKSLHVESILFNKDQRVDVLLSGSLRRKSDIDKLIDQVQDVPDTDLIKSFLNHYNNS